MRDIFTVFGSANLDVLAGTHGDETTLDVMGHVNIEVGGTGCNLAINLQALGAHARLVTAMNQSPFSKIIVDHLMETHIQMFVDYRDDLPNACFSAHIDDSGEMYSAVSSTPVDRHGFDDSKIHDAMDNASAVLVECNLSGKNMDHIVEIANMRGVPVFAASVSEEKALRLTEIKGKLDGIFINAREASYLAKQRLPNAKDFDGLADHFGCCVVITMGRDGTLVSTPGAQGKRVRAPMVRKADVVSYLGAGDMMMASTVFHHIAYRVNLHQAVAASLQDVRKLMTRRNCNLGQANAVANALMNMAQNAEYDHMTGVCNRSTVERMHQMLFTRVRAGTLGTYSLLVIDLNDLKRMNDQGGHDVGDIAIKLVAQALKDSLRAEDMAGRVGGDEFVVLLPGASEEAALTIGDRVAEKLEGVEVDGFPVRVSIGVGEVIDTDMDVDAVFRRADQAMYVRKKLMKQQRAESAAPTTR